MAMKCGNCQQNTIANRNHASGSSRPRAAAQPISGGMAPGTAPMSVQSGVLRLAERLVQPAALEQWKDAERQRIAERKTQPMQVLATAMGKRGSV